MNIIVQPDGPKVFAIPSNPVPPGARFGTMRTSDSVTLRYGLFPRTGEKARGTICLAHGRTEYIEKYFETIADFQKRGFAVATFDWRGQGGSERLLANQTLGHVENFEDYWTDLKDFHTTIVLPDCPPPYHLVGHSTGGLVSLLAAGRDRLMFDRVFLSAPLIGLSGLPLSSKWALRALDGARFLGLGRMGLGRREDRVPTEADFEGNALTSDRSRFMRNAQTLVAHSDLVIGSPTVGWVAAALEATAQVHQDRFPIDLKIPVFICAAAADRVVDTRATEALSLRMRTGHHIVIGRARHELFMEADPIRAQVFAAFDAFVTEQS